MKTNYLIGIVLIAMSCTLDDPRLVIDSRKVISLQPVDENLEALSGIPSIKADSISRALILVNLLSKSDGGKEVSFSTTAGVLTLVGQSPTAASTSTLSFIPLDREVIIQLNALDQTEEEVIVSGTSDKVSAVTKFSFAKALPVDFLIQPTSAIIQKTDTFTIHVTAISSTGVISENQYFEVTATSADAIEVDYPQWVKLKNQKADVKITNTSGKAGKVTLTIKVPTAAGTIKEKSVVITYS